MAKRDTVAGTPADPTVEYASLDIDGRSWKLCYSFNALAAAEHLVPGSNLMLGMATILLSGMSAVNLRAGLWAALSTAYPKMTLEDAGRLCRPDTIPDIQTALREAYVLSVPEKKREEFRALFRIVANQESETANSGDPSGAPPASFSDSPATSSIV